jgi:hypothetical protein
MILNIQVGFVCWMLKVNSKHWRYELRIFYGNHLFVKHEQAVSIVRSQMVK